MPKKRGNDSDVDAYRNHDLNQRESKELFFKVFQSSQDAITISTMPDSTFVDVNESFERIFGYCRDEVIGKTSGEINLWKYPEHREKIIPQYLKDGYLQDIRAEFIKKSGETGFGKANFRLIDINGVNYSIGIISDITEHKKIHEMLRQESANTTALINNTEDLVCSRDKEGALIMWNNAFAASIKLAFGVDPFIGMRTVEYLAPEQRANFSRQREAFQRVLTGESCHDEFEYRLPDGKTNFYKIAWSPIREDNEITGAVEITRNITDEKMKEKDLQKLAGYLIVSQEKELSRLARDLHDNLTQQLAVAAIEAGALERDFQDLPEPVLHKISSLKEQLMKISKEVHNISRDLHPSILDDLGLVRAIQSECSNFSARTGIAVIFTPPPHHAC